MPNPPGAAGDSPQPDLPAILPAVLQPPVETPAPPRAAAPAPQASAGAPGGLKDSASPEEQPLPPRAAPMIVPLPDLAPEIEARSSTTGAEAAAAAASSRPAKAQRAPRSPRTATRPARPPVQRSRPAGAPGLTAPGVTVIVFAGSLVGMLLDVFTGAGVGWLFGVVFIASSAYAALQVRRADRAAAIIAPPLVFAVLVMSDKFIGSTGDMVAKSVGALNALLDYGPMLWIGSGLTVVIVGFKMWQERRLRATSSHVEAPAAARTADAPPPS